MTPLPRRAGNDFIFTKRVFRSMREALGLTTLLLTATLLLVMPAGAQSDHSTTLVLDEIGAFNNTNDVHTNDEGDEIAVLYVGETFHLKGHLKVPLDTAAFLASLAKLTGPEPLSSDAFRAIAHTLEPAELANLQLSTKPRWLAYDHVRVVSDEPGSVPLPWVRASSSFAKLAISAL